MSNEPYKILKTGGEAECELKKSRFIAHLQPVETEAEAQDFVNLMKKRYYDARHNCYAYVIGRDADKVKYSDDGEPSQTAGLPIFNVLKESGVRNCCIVVTRYFGGTLLGAGPLARMYAEAAKLGLEASEVATLKYGVEFKITSDYQNGDKIRRYLETKGIFIVDTFYTDKVSIVVRADFDDFEKVKEDIVSLTASKVEISRISDAYFIDTKG